MRIAIVGAGAAGVAAARVFSRTHPTAVIAMFEESDGRGGVWDYQPSKSRPMYSNLRTNLPAELMAYREFPFERSCPESFVTHQTVQKYLCDYADAFSLDKFTKFNCKVDLVKFKWAGEVGAGDPLIDVTYTETSAASKLNKTATATFDHCVIANGHYAAPSIPPSLKALQDAFPLSHHSIAYDTPTASIYLDATILIIGGRASGSDIARELAPHARRIYVSDSTPQTLPAVPKVETVARTVGLAGSEKPGIELQDGSTLTDVDFVIFATGYNYDFPFLDHNIGITNTAEERRVSPLYEQLWHAEYPCLSFVGLCLSVVPFPFFELQAEAVAEGMRTGFEALPAREVRRVEAERDRVGGGAKGSVSANGMVSGGRVVDTHFLGSYQWDYLRRMAELGKVEGLENFIKSAEEIYDHAGLIRKQTPMGGKDEYREVSYKRDTVKFESWESNNVD